MPYHESASEFHERHGRECVQVGDLMVYRDGAVCEVSPWGLRKEPPADPHERAKVVLEYWEAYTRHAVEAFKDLKDRLLSEVQSSIREAFPPPPPDQLARLEALKAEAHRRQKRLAAARAEVERTVPEDVRRRKAVDARRKLEAEAFKSQVEKVKL